MAIADYTGETLDDRYHVEELVARGGMGKVYLGRHARIGRRVAIKVLNAELAADEEMVKRFFREAKAAVVNRADSQALETVADIERNGTTVLGIGIGDDTVRAAYSRAQVVEQPLDLAAAMVDGVRSTLLRTIAAAGGETWWVHSSSEYLQQQRSTAHV